MLEVLGTLDVEFDGKIIKVYTLSNYNSLQGNLRTNLKQTM